MNINVITIKIKYNQIFVQFLDIERFQKWIDACNSPKIQSKKPIDIYRQLRICRRHFDKESKNGGCRRLLNTAIPTLFLGPNNEVETSNDAIETESVSLQEPERLEYESYYIEDECELPEFEEPSKFTLNSNRNLKRGEFYFVAFFCFFLLIHLQLITFHHL